MPPKKGKKKGGKKGKKGGKKKVLKGMTEIPELLVKRLLKHYENQCKATQCAISPYMKKLMKDCMEKNQLLVKIILEPLPVESKDDPQVTLEPLISSLRGERYTYIKDIHIWDMLMKYENIATLALFLEKGFYQIRSVEMIDCLIEPHSVERLSRSFPYCKTLTHIILDYNDFGDEGCRGLCKGLDGNKTMLSVSMCYCDLSRDSGNVLGNMIATTAVRELYLDGNELGCEGAIDIIKLCVDQAELETHQKEEEEKRKAEEEDAAKTNPAAGTMISRTSSASAKSEESKPASAKKGKEGGKGKKKKKGKKGKKKKEAPPPAVGPWIHKLHLADNAIDGFCSDTFAPVICMRLFKQLLIHSTCLEEIDLDKNLIGDLGGREIMTGLEMRKEAKLKSVGVRTSHRLSADVYNTIHKLGAAVKKKKKGKGKKGKKKKK
ncbi:uncharacterized protein LOC135494713 [Lineus longissimus]|uniref:uncharacterized protein LOC135494713 n=1 Tax=Lineus longissimus TaxID=88925 RepID=UPI002B4D5830